MKFRASAPVVSTCVLQNDRVVEMPPYIFTLSRGEDGFLSHLTVARAVDDYDTLLPTLEARGGDLRSPHNLNVPPNPHHEDLLTLLQYLESLGCMSFGIKKILWEEAKYEWVADTPKERERLQVLGIGTPVVKYPEERVPFHVQELHRLMAWRQVNQRFVVPLSFVREAFVEFEHNRYINAYYNFYFYLEHLFGDGKSKNYQVEAAFQASPPLVSAVEQTIAELRHPGASRHRGTIEAFLTSRQWRLDTAGIIKTVVALRGELHHTSHKRPERGANPLRQRDYEAFAFLLMQLCVRSYLHELGAISAEFKKGGQVPSTPAT